VRERERKSRARERESERESRARERERESVCTFLACIVILSVCARAVVRVESVGELQVEVES
jgi:cell division septal protein FtsQ